MWRFHQSPVSTLFIVILQDLPFLCAPLQGYETQPLGLMLKRAAELTFDFGQFIASSQRSVLYLSGRSAAARSLWETMLVTKQKEAVMEVRRQLVEVASKENLPIKMSLGRVTGEQLSSYAQLFRDSWSALENHRGLLQLALGTAQTLRHPTLAQWDACLAFERLLLQAPVRGVAVVGVRRQCAVYSSLRRL
ncbi:sec1 family domain-containing protein 2 [Tachysurus ichikawai]